MCFATLASEPDWNCSASRIWRKRVRFTSESFRKEHREPQTETVQLELGDSVIFLSDGFCEAQNSVGEFFGMESVLEVCENSRENSPEEILQRLTEGVVSYSCGRPRQDDRTAAILRYIGK